MDPRDQRIADLESQLAARDERIAELEAQVAAKDLRIAELEGKVEELTRLVAALMDRLGRDSHNSHLPPSSDGPGRRPPAASKGKGKRKRGGQPGHGGHRRGLLPVDQVDHLIDRYPPECESCWAPLAQIPDPGATRYQVTELPPVKPEVTEERCHAVTCQCGYTTRARPHNGTPGSPFGPRLMATIATLTGVFHLSRRQAVRLLQDILGTTISLGAVSAVERRVSRAIEAPADEAWAKVNRAAVKHADATSWLQGGKLRSLWTLATTMATVFKIMVDGTTQTIRPFFGACHGILVSDRATVFSFWAMRRRQVCWAHLLRKFIAFSERDGPSEAFGRELLDATHLIFRYWHDFRRGKLDRDGFVSWMKPLRDQVERCLERAAAADIEGLSGSCADILAHREALWTFVEHDGVEPTNNHAERELRAFVLWRKRCFGTQSDRGNQFAERVMTVAHTARKQGLGVLAFITACCRAQAEGATAPSLFAEQTPA